MSNDIMLAIVDWLNTIFIEYSTNVCGKCVAIYSDNNRCIINFHNDNLVIYGNCKYRGPIYYNSPTFLNELEIAILEVFVKVKVWH